MNHFYMYILKCGDGSYYVGHTDNLELRLRAHIRKEYKGYTAARLPITLVFVQMFASRAEALDAEQQIKKWSRKKKEALIQEDWNQVSLFGKKKFRNKS